MFSALHKCGHVSRWREYSSAPKEGEHITCFACGAATVVRDLIGPWRVRCHDCRRLDKHAQFRKTVMNAAILHAQEWTTHRVWVWQYGVVDSRVMVGSSNVGAQPPLFSDAPF